MASKKNQNVLHIAVFPWLAHGHIMPFFELSKFLAQKGHKISFISTPKNLNRLKKLIPQNLSHLITLVSLPLPHVDGLPQGTESTSELPIHKVPFLKKAYDKLELDLAQFLKDSNDVNWIIHDFACYWLSRATSRLGIKLVFFSILNATSMAFMGPPLELMSGYRQTPEDFTVVPKWADFPYYDRAVAFKLYEITSHWDCMDSEVSDFTRVGELIQGCHAVISRTCPEFESELLILLEKLYQKPVLPIGFLPPTRKDEESPKDEWEGLKQWLDGKDENSVVYIALGTELSLTQDLMHELAHGIEKSGLSFIWVVNDRPLVEGTFGSNLIPNGFETRVSDRGLLWRGWAPQLKILGHPSVGGFLTHCGWSSVIEALGFGRALILFPGGSSDLGLIARLLHGRGIGLEIPRDDKTGSFTCDSVAESIRRVMIDEEGGPLRAKARAMKETFGDEDLHNKYLTEFTQLLVNKNETELI